MVPRVGARPCEASLPLFSSIRTMTVGFGVSPNSADPWPGGQGARGLAGTFPHTAGGEFHPALRTRPGDIAERAYI